MLSNRNRFLITSCLSVMVITLSNIPAQAGFEWTPPEQQQAEPAHNEPQLPKGSALPVPPPVVDEEILRAPPQKMTDKPTIPVVEKPVKASKPMMKSMDFSDDVQQKAEQSEPLKRKRITPSQIPEKQPAMTAEAPEIKPAKTKAKSEAKKAAPVKTETASKKPAAKQQAPAEVAKTAKPTELMPMPVEAQKVQDHKGKETEVAAAPRTEKSEQSSSVPRRKKPKLTREQQKALEASSEAHATIAATEKPAGLKINPFPDTKAPAATAKPDVQSKDVLQGFGADMPLAMALGQIVPPNYAYSFGEGVNPGLKISWNGGKPWTDVLTEALKIHKLSYEITGKKLVLMKADGSNSKQPHIRADLQTDDNGDPVKKKQTHNLN